MRKQSTVTVRMLARAAAVGLGVVSTPAAFAGTSANTQNGTPVRQGQSGGVNLPAATVSFSGQVATKPFTNGSAITFLSPKYDAAGNPIPNSITLNIGPGGTPVTYTTTSQPGSGVQLASSNFTAGDTGTDYSSGVPDIQRHSAIRFEWKEQGSAEGLIDLINDQVGYAGGFAGTPLSNPASRGATIANPIWVNKNPFNGTDGAVDINGNPTAGSSVSTRTINGLTLTTAGAANTYDPAVYNRATGANLQGGQNRIQVALGEYKTESFSRTGTASVFATPGSAGYGQGNTSLQPGGLNNTGLGVIGGRQQFRNDSVANLAQTTIDPQSPSNATYTAGPWNTAGANNIDTKQIAVTAVPLVANPGTGLVRVNKNDGQWLTTTGRLQNGADFNTVLRSIDTGQRIVPALNIGIDPSWAVGDNDGGNTSASTDAVVQRSIGDGIRYSGKTSGTEARGAIAQSRLGVGWLSLAEARGASSAAPIRALDAAFGDNPTDYVHLNFDSITNFTYKTILISGYNTVKAPRPDLLAQYQANNPGATPAQIQDWWNNLTSEETGIKGDTNGVVRAVINNISESLGTATVQTSNTAANPADGIFAAGFSIPNLLNFKRQYDGGPLTPNPLIVPPTADNPATPENEALGSLAYQRQQFVKATYGNSFTPDGSAGSIAQTIGTSANYAQLGAVSGSGNNALNGAIPITARNSAGAALANGVGENGAVLSQTNIDPTNLPKRGNYLFGNFNQDGKRDFASVKESVNAALSLTRIDGALGGKNGIFVSDGGVANNTRVLSTDADPSLPNAGRWADWDTGTNTNKAAATKGDLIVLGDYDSNGRFNGKDLFLLARGASLSDNGSTDQLASTPGSNFSDALRNADAKLNKNAALDYVQNRLAVNGADASILATSKTFLRTTAQNVVQAANDPQGLNAFNKFDVHKDGLINRTDAALVNAFIGKDYRNLEDVLGAVITEGGVPKQVNLVDIELTDSGVNNLFSSVDGQTRSRNILRDDFDLLAANLISTGGLTPGDVNLDGETNGFDIVDVLNNIGSLADDPLLSTWTSGDLTGDGEVNGFDLVNVLNDLGNIASFSTALSLYDEYGLAKHGVIAADGAFSAVPEPAGGLLLAAALGGLLGGRRRRRS